MNMVYIGIWLVVHAAKRVIICNHKIYQYDLSPDPGSLSLEASFHGSQQVSFPHKIHGRGICTVYMNGQFFDGNLTVD